MIDYWISEAYDLSMTSQFDISPGDDVAEQIRSEARERSIIKGVERGLADLKAGNTVPHDVAMAELDALIDGLGGLRCGPV